jgi:hypothetical protein
MKCVVEMRRWLWVLLVIPLWACTSPEKELTRNQQLLVLEYSYQTLLKGVDQQVRAGKLKGATAVEMGRLLVASKTALDAARLAIQAGRSDAATALVIANAAIAAAVTYLESRTKVSEVTYG